LRFTGSGVSIGIVGFGAGARWSLDGLGIEISFRTRGGLPRRGLTGVSVIGVNRGRPRFRFSGSGVSMGSAGFGWRPCRGFSGVGRRTSGAASISIPKIPARSSSAMIFSRVADEAAKIGRAHV